MEAPNEVDYGYLSISWLPPDYSGDSSLSHYKLVIDNVTYDNYTETSFYQRMDGEIDVSVKAVNQSGKESVASTLTVYIQGP